MLRKRNQAPKALVFQPPAPDPPGGSIMMTRSVTDTPTKRAAQREAIAPAYVFLAAPCCSSYITGEILPVIGGYASS